MTKNIFNPKFDTVELKNYIGLFLKFEVQNVSKF